MYRLLFSDFDLAFKADRTEMMIYLFEYWADLFFYYFSVSCLSVFSSPFHSILILVLLSEKDLVKQAKTLNSAANKLIPKHH